MSRPIVIVGAGLAGLVCARRLHRAGKSVLVIDGDTRPGGRLKTDTINGFRMDRGFQVYFSAYPNAGLELDLSRLNLKKMEPGARFWNGKKFREFHRENVIEMGFACMTGRSLVPPGDLLRLNEWDQTIRKTLTADLWKGEDMTAEELLRSERFSDAFINHFARPFFGGIFLDRGLNVSAQMFKFVWKMLGVGDTCVPALGMEEIPKQIAEHIPAECFRFRTRVDQLVKEGSRVTGVQLSKGEVVEAEQVIVATDASEAQRLTSIKTPAGFKSSTTVYFDAPSAPSEEAILLVDQEGFGRVNHLMDMTQVSRELSPGGHRLIAATILGIATENDAHLAKNVRYEIQQWLPKAGVEKWRPLNVVRVNQAQMEMNPGFRDTLPSIVTSTEGLFLAGEYTTYGSIDGACLSGRLCAEAILSAAAKAAA